MRPFTRQNLAPLVAVISFLGVPALRAEMAVSSPKGGAPSGIKEDKDTAKTKEKSKKAVKSSDAEGDKPKSSPNKGRSSADAGFTTGGTVECQVGKASSGLSGVTEASGVAASRRTPGILWSHGDSHVGEPYL